MRADPGSARAARWFLTGAGLQPLPACSIKGITKDSFYYVIVSGTKATDAGAFKLTLTTSKK